MAASQQMQLTTVSTGINAQKLAIFADHDAQKTCGMAAEVDAAVVVKDRVPCNLEVSLPHKILRLASESVAIQFARVPSPKQAKGTVAACNDYRKLQQAKKLGFWAEKILGLGAVGTDERAAATGEHDAQDVAKIDKRRAEMLALLQDLLVEHKARIAGLKQQQVAF